MGRCKATTSSGRRCIYRTKRDSDDNSTIYCGVHAGRWKKVDCGVCADIIESDPKINCNCRTNEVHRKCIIKDAKLNNRNVAICPICRKELPDVWTPNTFLHYIGSDRNMRILVSSREDMINRLPPPTILNMMVSNQS